MDRFKQSIDQQASQFLSTMINGGFVDTAFKPFDSRNNYVKYFEWFSCVGDKKRAWQNPNYFDLWTASQSQRWQESHLAPVTQPDIDNYWGAELAQFAVPHGQVGFVRSIEQVVNDINGDFYPTNVSYWGSPHFVDPDVSNLRWYFNISYFDGALPARYNLNSAVAIPAHALPGHPYPDLSSLDGLWYPAHNTKKMKLIVPGGHVLRFFVISPPTIYYQWTISGKISGNTQSTYSDCAITNSREIY